MLAHQTLANCCQGWREGERLEEETSHLILSPSRQKSGREEEEEGGGERERDAMGEVRGPFPHSSSVGSDEGDRYDPFFLPPFLRLRLVFLSFFVFPLAPKKGGIGGAATM